VNEHRFGAQAPATPGGIFMIEGLRHGSSLAESIR
jgi:hypothetical protein